MKKLLSLSILTLSFNTFAVDVDKYCLPFLNGKLEEQSAQPDIMEGFTASKAKLEVAGSVVDTITITPNVAETKGDVKVTNHPWGEEAETTILKYKKNGKPVTDYKMVVSRDKLGNLISISKKPVLFQDFKLKADTLYFKPQNDTCIPERYVGKNKLKFSLELCREIDRFFAENPSARECLVSRHDQKLAALVKAHAKSLVEKFSLGLEKGHEDRSALYAAKHRVDCSENGVDVMLNDRQLWENFLGKRGEEKIKSKSKEE